MSNVQRSLIDSMKKSWWTKLSIQTFFLNTSILNVKLINRPTVHSKLSGIDDIKNPINSENKSFDQGWLIANHRRHHSAFCSKKIHAC